VIIVDRATTYTHQGQGVGSDRATTYTHHRCAPVVKQRKEKKPFHTSPFTLKGINEMDVSVAVLVQAKCHVGQLSDKILAIYIPLQL
jgi:hypothetical protein